MHKEKNEMERQGKKNQINKETTESEPEEGFQTHSAASSMPKFSFPTLSRSCFFQAKITNLLWAQVLRLLEDRGQISPQGTGGAASAG